MPGNITKRHLTFEHRGKRYESLIVRAGRPRTEHVVPPAGAEYSFDRDCYPVEVEVTVSPTGRVVHVWVNGRHVVSTNGRPPRGVRA